MTGGVAGFLSNGHCRRRAHHLELHYKLTDNLLHFTSEGHRR
jgi:hypothetical protein